MTWSSRRAAWIAAALAGSLLLAGVAGEISGWPFLQQPLRDALQRAAGIPVQLEGRFRVHLLWRPRLLVERLTVGSAAGVPAPHLVDGRQVAIAWHWGDVWRWRRGGVLVLRSMRADALDVHLVRLADGRASWQIGRARGADGPARSLPKVGRLAVDDGHVTIDDRLLDTQLRIDVRGREGGGSERQAGDGYRADISGRYRASTVKLAFSSGGALPLLRDDQDASGVTTTPLRVDGEVGAARIVFDGQAAALMGGRHLDGALRFSGPSLAWVGQPLGLALPQTPAFNLQGRLTHHDGVWTLRADRATIGRSELVGDFRYDTTTRPARLSGKLAGPRLLLADLGPSIGAPTGGSARLPTTAQRAPRGQVLPQQRFNVPSLRAMNADVQVAIDQLVFSTSAVNPLHNLRTHL
ncbi:MAG TPA: hypothetical protein VLJ62_23945, partial [Burkholderiaceae bacterium]|nr:hypothetical protein [Burkholderiaceae bacterium]